MLAFAVLMLSGCAAKEYPAGTGALPVPPPEPVPPAVQPSAPEPAMPQAAAGKRAEKASLYHETGVASWFGREQNGRKTAGGEVIDGDALTAFHRTLPLGSVIRVTNLDNQKSAVIRVIDRGPFVANRVLEVSAAAARELGFTRQGTARVALDGIDVPAAPAQFTVQAAVFSEAENANLLKDRLSRRYEIITILPLTTNLGTLYRVRIGSYGSEEKAAAVAAKLRLEGLEPFVLRKD